LSATNAVSEAATSAETPRAERTAQTPTPIELPTVVRNAAHVPPTAALRTTSAIPGPGLRLRRNATGTNVHSMT
jgi:hypothetical protein